jgi:hypothetical protein
MVERDASRKISVRFGDSSTRFKMKDPKRHPSPKWLPIRVRMEAGRVGGCEQQFLMGRAIKTSLRQQRKPLSRSPQGDAGAGGVPPTPQNRRLPPQEGKPPCAIPQRLIGRFYLTRTGLLMEAMRGAKRIDWCRAQTNSARTDHTMGTEPRSKPFAGSLNPDRRWPVFIGHDLSITETHLTESRTAMPFSFNEATIFRSRTFGGGGET